MLSLRRIAGTVAAVVALAGAAAMPATASPSHAVQEDRAPVPTVRLVAQTREVAPDGDFTVFVSIAGLPTGGDLAVDIYDPIKTRDQLRASETLEPANERDRFDPLPIAATTAGPAMSAFTIHLHDEGPPRPGGGAWSYRLTDPGVYPIRLRLRDGDGDVLTSAVTYLVRTAGPDETPVTPTPVALLVPIQAPVSDRLDVTEPVSEAQRTAIDETLATFADHSGLPATFAVTPDTAARLADDPDAQGTLDSLVTAVSNPRRELLGAPYVPVDPAAMVASGLTDELRRQIDLGRRTLRDTVKNTGTTTWWTETPLDEATIDQLLDTGVSRLVVPDTVLAGNRPSRPLLLNGSTPDRALQVTVTGPVTVPAGAVDDPILVVHQLLGRLAAITSTGSAAVMVVDPMTVEPALLALLVDEIEKPGTYLAPSTVSRIFDATADATATPVQPPAPDLGAYPNQIRATRDLAANYGSMLADPSPLGGDFDRRLALAAAETVTPTARVRLFDEVDAELRSQFSVVKMAESERVTLGARDAIFPLTIRSEASTPLKVMITLRSSDRLGLPENQIEATLKPGRTIVSIPVQTRTSGDAPLFITVTTPDGQIVLADSRYTIRSTAVSGVGLVLTIGAAAFLALWWARHWHRTAKERKAAAVIARALDDERLFIEEADGDPDGDGKPDDERPAPTTLVTDSAPPGSDTD